MADIDKSPEEVLRFVQEQEADLERAIAESGFTAEQLEQAGRKLDRQAKRLYKEMQESLRGQFIVCARLLPLLDPFDPRRRAETFADEAEARAFLAEKKRDDPAGDWDLYDIG